ncbi:MAG TPA: Uma2 family endonuclease [Blastocatellia bacterium]|nr:Uma2 family endonuclease [Blastocatellia bacterium]HMV85788.1 Uma2 family endonuclease [Blastocatellia bacterium]HMY72654.1 Uma2 family endonuclease [Blastocatellia bacterium]HMZ20154.1 Uma2 family endonuclease [Blastocatellia bacterium]HNG32497.1 Uma2 family endonuclease [Blastocatellia bacterium]
MALPQRYQHYTEQEFAALVKVSERRLELWDGQIFDMSYASPTHRDIVRNLVEVLGKKLKPPCAPYTGEPIRPAKTTGVFREPDLVVLCGPRKIETIHGLELSTNPVVIIEVVSPETETTDRNEKLDEYRSIPTLREYLIVAQRSANVTQWTRRDDLWRESVAAGLAASITLDLSPKITLALRDIYREIEFK